MLEHLTVVYCKGLGKVELTAPCLKYLAFDQPVPDICFKYTPLLSYVSLSWCVSRTPGMVALFASLPALQQFYVHYEILRFLAAGVDNAPARLPTLHLLKVLGITHLIKSWPQRDQLTKNKESSSLWGLLEADDCPGSSVCLQHLTEFRIYDGHCTQVELDLVRFILANAPLLKRVIISLAHTLCSEKVMKFIKDMARCKRVSKEAEVIYASDDED
ncbi:unnamed protein product [Linum tenue]|uniref:FBD domain-containing protein n=1 Tax=Linum tenue TaxID=586396 RepID=A0AAV0NJX6_9ROSI|nr:unnamed protein product [Linum tenue]